MFSRPTPLAASAILALSAYLAAAPPAPKPPAEYSVIIRYQIDAFRTEHVIQFDQMVAALKQLGFQKVSEVEDERESRAINRMLGTIASADARRLLSERHVRTVLLLPREAELPAEADQPVRLHLDLATGLEPSRQRVLADQTRDVLKELGFREAIGYDHRGHTRLVGMLAIGRLETLLTDLRKHPAGAKQPAPFQGTTALRVIEVMTGLEPTANRPAPPEVPRGMETIAPGLRALLADKEAAERTARLEVVLSFNPPAEDRSWLVPLRQAAPGLIVEGRVGPLVSVQVAPAHVPALAALPIVAAVRLPQSARPQGQAEPPAVLDPREALRASGLERLHGLGHRGRGVRAAVIDGDFRGWQERAGKGLPADTVLIDLTRARSRDLEPDPTPGDPKAVGHGTRCALLLMQAAPEAGLTLIRIDLAAPYQLQEAARFINGERFRSFSLDNRADQLDTERHLLEQQRGPLLEERRLLLNLVDDDDEIKKRWEAYRKKQAEFDRQEQAYEERLKRYVRLHEDLRGLKGTHVVACPLVWNEGHPVDGGSALSRYFDDRPFGAALWFQSAGNTRGQAWTGLFRDVDGNGVMEFVPPGAPLPGGRWTPELNFVGWQPFQGNAGPDVPAGARLRVSIQWREAHDPEFLRAGEDAYQVPLAELRLVVLRQRDPSGAKLPADDLEVVAQSAGQPLRLDNQPSSGVYEQSVEFTAEVGGRYVVRVEGRAPAGIRPRGAPTLPAIEKSSELRPRVFVETLQGPGRAVLLDFTSDRTGRAVEGGSLGMPADARQVITVGAADRSGQPQPYSAGGPPMNLDLLIKPDVLAYDVPGLEGGPHGTSLATAFAAGLSATALSAGAPRGKFLQALQVTPGGVLRIPRDWPARGR